MFPEEVFAARLSEIKEGNFIYINGFNQWVSVSSKKADLSNPKIIVVTWKQLRAILAKEHLKAGDWVVCENKEIGVTEIIRVSRVGNESIHTEEWADLGGKTTKQGPALYCLKCFKRYSTPEEIQYFDNPHAEDSPVGKWCKFWQEDTEDKTIRKYGEPCDASTYPHKDIRGAVWRNYSLIPEPLQTLLSNL